MSLAKNTCISQLYSTELQYTIFYQQTLSKNFVQAYGNSLLCPPSTPYLPCPLIKILLNNHIFILASLSEQFKLELVNKAKILYRFENILKYRYEYLQNQNIGTLISTPISF